MDDEYDMTGKWNLFKNGVNGNASALKTALI